ncbi:nucleolar complex protein 4 homolog B isoform X1 [Centruroides vittatus]|uniref:nucleolar complex protein 4 homolog B isoform X1 n=1 Tax=Centruroides vittatus TaxID=120091 RepID=UPI00350EFB1B
MAPVKKRARTDLDDKKCFSELQKKADQFLTDRSCSNNLLDIISLCISDEEEVVIEAQKTLEKIFVFLLNKNELDMQDLENNEVLETEKVYKSWLQECYADAKKQLIENLDASYNIQECALSVLMNLVKEEGLNLLKNSKKDYFSLELLTEIIQKLLSEEKEQKLIIIQLTKFFKYEDIKCNVLKSIVKILKDNNKQESNSIFLENIYTIISKIHLNSPKKEGKQNKDDDLNRKLFINSDNENNVSIDFQYMRRMFTSIWLEFLKFQFQLTPKLYKKVLTILDQNVISDFTNPLLLADFLTKAYNAGGSISLLALNGIFTLMQNYNLEYPDFYKKLYALFDASVFYSQYKANFFFLADVFLSSTHIPEYLVAAFIKRLSRLCLIIPASSLFVVIPFIRNLLIRHQLQILINNPSDVEITDDPYIMDEPDPLKCKALESSLWEIKTLQSHWHPEVAIKARFINKPLPKMESDLSEFYELDSHELFEKEISKEFRDVPLNFEKPLGLFKGTEVFMF